MLLSDYINEVEFADHMDKIKAEMKRLREALHKYGKHEDNCDCIYLKKNDIYYSSTTFCSCGLDEILEEKYSV